MGVTGNWTLEGSAMGRVTFLATMPLVQGYWNGIEVVTSMPGQILAKIHSNAVELVDTIKNATKIKVTYTAINPVTLDVYGYSGAVLYSFGEIVSGVEYIMPDDSSYSGYSLDFKEETSWSAFSISKIELITL